MVVSQREKAEIWHIHKSNGQCNKGKKRGGRERTGTERKETETKKEQTEEQKEEEENFMDAAAAGPTSSPQQKCRQMMYQKKRHG